MSRVIRSKIITHVSSDHTSALCRAKEKKTKHSSVIVWVINADGVNILPPASCGVAPPTHGVAPPLGAMIRAPPAAAGPSGQTDGVQTPTARSFTATMSFNLTLSDPLGTNFTWNLHFPLFPTLNETSPFNFHAH